MAMMSLLNSSERDLDSWLALFHEADPRLRLVKVVQPLGSALSIMELELGKLDDGNTLLN
jgi:6-hydroxytryprostatin B O-methyltransferase